MSFMNVSFIFLFKFSAQRGRTFP